MSESEVVISKENNELIPPLKTKVSPHNKPDKMNLFSRNNLLTFPEDSLYKEVSRQFSKNKAKLNQLVKIYPNFDYDLYTPNLAANKQLLRNNQLMERQLERLIKDSWQLDKQINKINFQTENKEDMLKFLNIFQFLRTSWAKTIVADNAEEKLEEINRRIGCIKGQIKKVVDKENRNDNEGTFEDIVKNSSYYLAIERERNQLSIQKVKLQLRVSTLKEQVSKLSRQNQKTNWDLHLEKQSNCKLQQRLNESEKKMASGKDVKTKEQLTSLQELVEEIPKNYQQELQKSASTLQYWSQSHEFKVTIESKLLNSSAKIETKRTLKQVQSFFETLGLDKLKQNFDLRLNYFEGNKDKMSEHLKQIMAYGKPERYRRIRGKAKEDPERQLINEQEKLGGTERKNKEDVSDLVSLDSKKRFCRSPKLERQSRYQLNF